MTSPSPYNFTRTSCFYPLHTRESGTESINCKHSTNKQSGLHTTLTSTAQAILVLNTGTILLCSHSVHLCTKLFPPLLTVCCVIPIHEASECVKEKDRSSIIVHSPYLPLEVYCAGRIPSLFHQCSWSSPCASHSLQSPPATHTHTSLYLSQNLNHPIRNTRQPQLILLFLDNDKLIIEILLIDCLARSQYCCCCTAQLSLLQNSIQEVHKLFQQLSR